jgi:hypothetical protein
MSLTVRQLIAKLRKMPPDGVVGWADHDHSEDELNALVRCVDEASDTLKRTHGVDVVLRA